MTIRWKDEKRQDLGGMPYALHYDPHLKIGDKIPVCSTKQARGLTDEPLHVTCLSCRKAMRDKLGILTPSTNVYNYDPLTKENLR